MSRLLVQKNLRGLKRLKEVRCNQQETLQLRPAPTPRLLSEKEVREALCHLQGWSRQGNKLHRQYQFSSFEKALAFMSALALAALGAGNALEESEVYDSVSVDLTTPSVGGIADVDVQLATQAEALADSLNLLHHLDSIEKKYLPNLSSGSAQSL